MKRQRAPRLTPALTTLTALLCAAFAAVALAGPGAGTAMAAGCPGGDKAPRKVSSKTAAKAIVCLVNKERRKHGLGKRDGRLLTVLDIVMREYDEGRVTSLADEEVASIVDAAFASN